MGSMEFELPLPLVVVPSWANNWKPVTEDGVGEMEIPLMVCEANA